MRGEGRSARSGSDRIRRSSSVISQPLPHPPGTQTRVSVPHAARARVSVPHAARGRVSVPHAARGRVSVPHAARGRTSVPHAARGRVSVPHAARGRTYARCAWQDVRAQRVLYARSACGTDTLVCAREGEAQPTHGARVRSPFSPRRGEKVALSEGERPQSVALEPLRLLTVNREFTCTIKGLRRSPIACGRIGKSC
jgi:hypothetical protein